MRTEINDDCIFHQDNARAETPAETEQKYYTLLGNQDYVDSENFPRLVENGDKVFAKNIGTKYYVLQSPYGKLYNPLGMNTEYKTDKFLAKIGRNEYSFKQVNQRIFNFYVNFLRSRNVAWINNAERELS